MQPSAREEFQEGFDSYSSSNQNSEVEQRFAKMNDIKRNTKSIFLKKVQQKNQMMLESNLNFDVNSICDGGLKGWNIERNQSMTQRDVELISNLN